MKIVYLASILVLLTACVDKPELPPVEALNAIEELRRVNSAVEVGLNQVEYSNRLADVKYAVDRVNSLKNSNLDSNFISSINGALQAHLLALNFWQKCYSSDYPYNCQSTSEGLASIFSTYPDLQSRTDLATSLPIRDLNSTILGYTTNWNTSGILSAVWQRAEDKTTEAASALEEGK